METALANEKNSKKTVRLKAASGNVPQLNDKGQLLWSSVTGSGFASSSDGYGTSRPRNSGARVFLDEKDYASAMNRIPAATTLRFSRTPCDAVLKYVRVTIWGFLGQRFGWNGSREDTAQTGRIGRGNTWA
ncbi:hypothetical protein PI124_g10073 [Phytophthora idaei]|nr:hypothetical protein PI124_g10073 [Phytophthora idaei]